MRDIRNIIFIINEIEDDGDKDNDGRYQRAKGGGNYS